MRRSLNFLVQHPGNDFSNVELSIINPALYYPGKILLSGISFSIAFTFIIAGPVTYYAVTSPESFAAENVATSATSCRKNQPGIGCGPR